MALHGGTSSPAISRECQTSRYLSLFVLTVSHLRYVFKIACCLLKLCTNDVGDRFIIGHTACTIRAVREELRVEVEGYNRHNAGEWEVIKVGVILLAEPAVGAISTFD